MKHWTKEWPTEPGAYWFCGTNDRSLQFVRAFQGGASATAHLAFVADGAFLYKAEAGEGLWLPADVPEIPTGEGPVRSPEIRRLRAILERGLRELDAEGEGEIPHEILERVEIFEAILAEIERA